MRKTILMGLISGLALTLYAESAKSREVQEAAATDSAEALEPEIEQLARQNPYTPPVKPTKNFTVRDEKVMERDGRTITFREVAPPARKPKPVRVQTQPTPEQFARMERLAEKGYTNFTFFGTVWDEKVTEVEWHYEGVKYRVFVNADLSFLHAMPDFETEESFYSVVGMLAHGESKDAEHWIPNRGYFNKRGEKVPYAVVEPETGELPEEAFSSLDALLSHYEANREELWDKYTELSAKGLARKRYYEANPPSEDITVNFWKKEDNQ